MITISQLKGILPVVRNMKDFENLLHSQHDYIVFLESRLTQITSLVKYAKQHNKKVLVHADLIQGMKTDDFGFEFLLREIKPDGIISTRGNVITLAKKNNLLAIQRLFALDTHALEKNIAIINKVGPDYIEVLPGIVPKLFGEIYERTTLPVIAGGLVRTKEEVQQAYDGGAKAVTTSCAKLW